MKRILPMIIAATVAAAPVPAGAQAVNFTLINNTDIDFSALMVRRFGTDQWVPLTVAPVPVSRSGGRGVVNFSNPDCAFDLRAKLPDGRMVVWPGVNLCEVKSVTLNRDSSGHLWVDYE